MVDGWTDLTCSKWDRMQVNAAPTKEDTAAGMETGVRSAGEGTKVPARQIGGQRRLLLKPRIMNSISCYVSTGRRTIFAPWKGVDKVLISRRKTTATRIGDRRTRHKDGTREQKICSKYKVKSN